MQLVQFPVLLFQVFTETGQATRANHSPSLMEYFTTLVMGVLLMIPCFCG